MHGHFWGNTQYFNPRQVGNLVLWLDATDPAANGTQPADLSSVSTWVDKSTAGNNLIQGTGANQPTYRTGILNSKPVVRFNGVNSYMQKSTVTSLGSQCSIFVAGTIRTNGSNRGTFYEYSNAGTVNTGTIGFFESGGGLKYINRVVVATVPVDDNFSTTLPFSCVVNGVNNGTNNILYINGTQQVSNASGNMDATSRVTIGALVTLPAGYWLAGDIGEMIVYNTAISDAQRTLVTRYLGNKWGFTVA